MTNNRFDVGVIGAGPSGAFAAYELAKRGISVALIEKEKLPRYKACGGVVAPHVEKLIDFSLDPVIERRISKMLVSVRFKSPFLTYSPKPFAYLVMRDTFDNFLVEQAKSEGVRVFDNTPLQSLESEGETYLLRSGNNHFQVRYIVAADGANSATRKLVEAPRFQRLSVAIEREVRASQEILEQWKDTVALDFGGMSSGYAWVFPKLNNFSLGIGGPKSVAKDLARYYAELVAHYGKQIGYSEPYISAGHYLPIRVMNEQIVFDRVLFIGDAAGLIEPLAGEGIYYAMQSAQFAAVTLHDVLKNGSSNKTLFEYQRQVDLEIQPELQISKSLLYILDRAPSFWVPMLMQPTHTFWKYFYRIFTGEKNYRDFPKKFGPLGQILYLMSKNN